MKFMLFWCLCSTFSFSTLVLREFSAYKREKLTAKERYLFSSFTDQVHWEHLACSELLKMTIHFEVCLLCQ